MLQKVHGGVSFHSFERDFLWVFINWKSLQNGYYGFIQTDQQVSNKIESGSGIKEAIKFVHDLHKEFANTWHLYVGFSYIAISVLIA